MFWPAKPGRMRGRSTHPTGREKECVGATGPSFYKERLGTESPPHPSPSVTASPQGEASGLCSPTRKSVPNQGTDMGTVIALPSLRCATHAKTSEWERAGHKNGGPGGKAPGPLSPHFSGEMGTPPGRRAPGALRPEAPKKPRPLEGYAVPYRSPARDWAGTHVAGANLRRSQRNRLPMTERPTPVEISTFLSGVPRFTIWT